MRVFRVAAVLLGASALLLPVLAEEEGGGAMIDCEIRYNLKGWSAFYKTAKGEGTITCDNGQSFDVKIKLTGGGITFGKRKVVDGKGKFSEVESVDELFGAYAHASAHAGASGSAEATVLTKGEVSLALAGTGKGVDIGVDFGKFTILRK